MHDFVKLLITIALILLNICFKTPNVDICKYANFADAMNGGLKYSFFILSLLIGYVLWNKQVAWALANIAILSVCFLIVWFAYGLLPGTIYFIIDIISGRRASSRTSQKNNLQ